MPQGLRPGFIFTCFCTRCRERAEALANFLEEIEVRTILGEDFDGCLEISDGVRSRIESCSFGIAIFTRKKKRSGGEGTWEASRYVQDEAVAALNLKRPLVILKERGVEVGGMLKNREHLVFEPGKGFDVEFLRRVVRRVKAVYAGYGLTIGLKPEDDAPAPDEPVVHVHVADDPIEGDCASVAGQIRKVKALTKKGQFGEALELAQHIAMSKPACWPPFVSMSGLLAKLGRLAEADEMCDDILRRFERHSHAKAAALHNKAAILEATAGRKPPRGSLVAQHALLEESLRLHRSRVYTRASLVIVLTQLGEVGEAVERLEGSFEFGKSFEDAFKFELESRGLVVEILSKLPRWVERRLYSVRRFDTDEDGE